MLHINKNLKTMDRKAVRWQIMTIAFLSLLIGVFCFAGSAAAVVVSIAGDTLAESDGATTCTFTVQITSGTVIGNSRFDFTTINGTATTGDNDYSATTTIVRFNNGENNTSPPQTIIVPINGDTKVEGNETFTVTLTPQLPAIDSVTGSPATGTIQNDDQFSLSVEDAGANEGSDIQFIVTLNTEVDVAVSGILNLSDISATGGIDYNDTSIGFAFTPGPAARTQPFNVSTTGDLTVEADETFLVTLDSLHGDWDGNDDTGTGTITDNDTATLTISGPVVLPQDEDSGGYVFTVTLDNAVQGGFDVAYTTDDGTATVADNDYADNDGTLPFLGTAAEFHTITVAITADTVVEDDETFTVTLDAITPVSADASDIGTSGSPAMGTITNDDQFGIAVNNAIVPEGTPAVFWITLGNDIDVAVSVTYDASDGTATVADGDYTDIPGTVTFPAFSPINTTRPFSVDTTGDGTIEWNEDFTVTVSSLDPDFNGTDSIGTGTILNDDFYTVSIDDIVVNETIGNATFTVSLNQAVIAGDSVTIDYTTLDGSATAGNDYTAATTNIPIPAGSISGPIVVPISNDLIDEGDEVFFVNLTASTPNGLIVDSQGQCTITDNDYTLTPTITPFVGQETGTISPADPPVPIVVAGGTDYTFTITPGVDSCVKQVTVDGVPQGPVTTHTFTNITSDHTINVEFRELFRITGNIQPYKARTLYGGAGMWQAYDTATGGGDFTTGGWMDHQQNVTIADCTVTEITVEYQAQAGWETPLPQTVTITDNTTVEGTYRPILTVVSSNGRVTSVPAGIDCGGDCTEIYDVDTTVILTAVADVAGYVFSEFQDDASGPLSPTQVFMDEPKTVTAVFVLETPGNEDADGDGWSIDDGDCDDTNAQIYPGAVEQCTATDWDCDGLSNTTTPVDPDCQDLALADVPLETQLQAAPANIMFVLDNSGSMDWEFSTTEPNGLFEWEYYIFDDPGDNAYWGQILDTTQRQKYRSQWSGYNRMYYNPTVEYITWPLGDGTRFADADPDFPRSNPESAVHTLDMSDNFVAMAGVNIINAHYFTWNDTNSDTIVDNGEIYLIELDGAITYYQFMDGDANDTVDVAGELIDVTASPPAGIVTGRTYAEERQSFANWYSFYRKRELTAKAAIGEVIDNLKGVQVGFYTINAGLRYGVKKVRVTEDDGSGNKIYTDFTASLLHDLYNVNSGGGTPLRTALSAVGQYYEVGGWDGGLGSPPWYADASGDCQQAFTIVMTDGYYNGGDPGVPNNDGDGDQAGTTDPAGDELYWDNNGETLADVAMKYYKNDLDGDATNNRVPTNFADSAEHQHMVTYTVSFGVIGDLNPDDYDLDNANPTLRNYPVWTNPDTDARKIDDMWHAAVNGRGLYLNADSPEELVSSLLEILLNLTGKIGAGASLSINGEELYAGTTMFQASYSTDGWTGDVFAYTINATTGEVLIGEGLAIWTASEELGSGSDWDTVSWDTGREIATFNPDPLVETGIKFRWANLTTDQKAFLSDDPHTGAVVENDIVAGEARLEYLRGNNAQEERNSGNFRDRFSKLGDIVHSSPLFEGYDTNNDGVDDYGMLYVGANDGMLHAFVTSDIPGLSLEAGQEVFAYVPNLVFENLNGLTLPEPDFRHRYFVDLTPLVKNIGTAAVPEKLLVGGLGKGGKGYYCLDVTNGNTISETDLSWVKWEYPRQDSDAAEKDNMGYSFSRASIVKSYAAGHPWVVIFGNGYGSTNESSVLYILDASTGDFIRTIDTGTSGNGNGMSHAVPVDINGDFRADFVYAGDLSGNMWKFDLRDSDPANWGSAFGDNDIILDGVIDLSDGETPKPLFKAMGRTKSDVNSHTYDDTDTWSQPITTQPIIIRHCNLDKPGYLVLFGTGKYLAEVDADNTEYQTIYGIWDYGDEVEDYLGDFKRGVGGSGEDEFSNPIQASSATLLQQWVQWWGPNPYNVNQNLRVLTDNQPDWETFDISERPKADAGWYFDLPLNKERVVRDPVFRNGILIIISSRPENDPCSAGGRSIIHEMDACTGGRLDAPQFDINADGVIDENDMISIPNPNWDGVDPLTQFIMVAPTGMEIDAMIFPPVILILPDKEREIKYFVTAGGDVVAVTEVADQRGLFFWRHVR